jgi:FimV-like protein
MSAARLTGAVLLRIAAACAAFAPYPVLAQAASSYEIRKGDTLFAVARKSKHDNVTRNQMILAIYRANQGAFADGNINRLEIGTVLKIPGQSEAAQTAAVEADRQVQELLAAKPAPAPPPIAAVKPAPGMIAPARPSAADSLTEEAAAKRYRDGLNLERRGDHQGALTAFLEAGEGGHGLAQRKLGQIYDKGNAAAPRDFQKAIKWYEKARAQGVEIDKPLPRMGAP